MSGLVSAVSRRLWTAEYKTEEFRQRHAAAGRVLLEAWACLVLAFLRCVR